VTAIDVDHAAALLIECRDTGRTIPEMPDGLRPADADEAYAIQDALHQRSGWDIAALKVGATSERAQQALGLSAPIAAGLPQAAIWPSGSVIDAAVFHHPPRLESEFALRLGVDVTPAEVDALGDDLSAVRTLVDAVAPALELVDTRFSDQLAAGGPSLIADNSVAAAIVLGDAVDVDTAGDLVSVAVSLCQGETELATGSGAEVFGNPFLSLRWVLGHEASRGRTVPAGTWVITGTCTGLLPYPMGEEVIARFDGMGEVSVTVTE